MYKSINQIITMILVSMTVLRTFPCRMKKHFVKIFYLSFRVEIIRMNNMKYFFYIANSLDKNGYFPGGIIELSGIFNTDKFVLNNCLDIMKKPDPKGVCAKDLSECLQLQLDEESTYATEKAIINNHLDLLSKNDLRKISKLLNTDIDNVIKAKENILKLNPRPSQGFSERQTLKYIIPDITIVKFKDHFDIVTNDLFQLNINYDYIKYIKMNSSDQQLSNYISHKINEINILKDNITKRNTTLLKLAEYILESQKNFFLLGKEHLKPCKMKDASKTPTLSEIISSIKLEL